MVSVPQKETTTQDLIGADNQKVFSVVFGRETAGQIPANLNDTYRAYCTEGGILVYRAGRPTPYRVDVQKRTCTCIDFQSRKHPCKHLRHICWLLLRGSDWANCAATDFYFTKLQPFNACTWRASAECFEQSAAHDQRWNFLLDTASASRRLASQLRQEGW